MAKVSLALTAGAALRLRAGTGLKHRVQYELRKRFDTSTEHPVDPTIRLRLATRIHFALLRQYSEDIAVSALLKGEPEGREALWVCEGSGQDELITLARQFRSTPWPMPLAGPAAAQDLGWSNATSSFGVVPPAAEAEIEAAKPQGWLNPSRWLRPREH
jgi:hypothetical protein